MNNQQDRQHNCFENQTIRDMRYTLEDKGKELDKEREECQREREALRTEQAEINRARKEEVMAVAGRATREVDTREVNLQLIQ